MMDMLAHRGQDGANLCIDGAVGLGHRMLWITPESLGERLPFKNAARTLWITADARIDNREELIKQLCPAHEASNLITDSELILAAYEEWGEESFAKLLGDFVFAIWDDRKKALYCVRDTFGVKHFYYYRSEKLFAFASEIKALLCLREVPRVLNEVGVADYLLPVYEDKVITLYKDILRLPACHFMKVTREGTYVRRYWEPDLSRELKLRKDEDYADAFRELFTEAVRCRLRSAYPVASMLSGGLDSSSVCCVAGKLLAEDNRPRLHTFSGIWPNMAELDPEIDERRYMQAVVSKGWFDHHDVRADLLSPMAEYDKMLWHQDNALSATNMYMDWAIFKAAHENGARVILGGTDGDTTVSYGYEDLTDFATRGRWWSLFRESRALKRNMPMPRHTYQRLVWNCGFKAGYHARAPEYIKQTVRRLRGRPKISDETSALPSYCRNRPINLDFAKRVGILDRFWALQRNTYPANGTSREIHWGGVSSGMFSYILETYEKSCAVFSVEPRHPFFDRRLIEFCISLPPGQKLHNGWTRSPLRRAMAGLLPPEIETRIDKGNLSVGLKLNLLAYERERIENILMRDSESIEGYVDMPFLREAYRRYEANPLDYLDECFSVALVASLHVWLQNSGLPLNTNGSKPKARSYAGA